MFHVYGTTESTVICSVIKVVPGIYDERNVGKPFPNVPVAILVPGGMQKCTVGVPGELCVPGPQVSRGYSQNPVETSKLFSNTFQLNGNGPLFARQYRTGDLLRWLPNGTLEFLGRIDQQCRATVGLQLDCCC